MTGVGKRNGGKRAGFTLKTVSDETGMAVYDDHERKIKHGPFTRELIIEKPADGDPVHSVEITIKTPLRLKYENKLHAELPFHILIRAMLRRASSLLSYHGNGEPDLDYRGLVERAKGVEIKRSSLRWFDWKRYSNKQDQAMLMGGMVGRVAYAGDLTEFLPLIRFCEKAHIGKQTSFGLGRIEITGMNKAVKVSRDVNIQ